MTADENRLARQREQLELWNRINAQFQAGKLGELSGEDFARIAFALGSVVGLESRVDDLQAEVRLLKGGK
jgi:hypothetical protein